MNAKEARVKYLEKYIEFEHLVRRLATNDIPGFKTRGVSFDNVITAIAASNIMNNYNNGLNPKILRMHKKPGIGLHIGLPIQHSQEKI